jgi:hypothetical protein
MRVDELIDQAGFPDSSLPYRCHHLAMSSFGLFESLMQHLNFWVSPDKLGEPTDNGGLQTPADDASTGQFIDLDRFCHALDGYGSSCMDAYESFDQSKGGTR